MNRIDITLRAATRRALAIGLLAALLLALGAAAPAVLAAITCPGGGFEGTNDDDTLQGTAGVDHITGFGWADTISGSSGNDELTGFGGADLLVGGRGGDIINAQEVDGHPPGTDTIQGGRGNDTIYANDGVKDKIDCGPGRDIVYFDPGLDTLANCEMKNST
jgi:Ca2+-binding RTX toxin-like protein